MRRLALAMAPLTLVLTVLAAAPASATPPTRETSSDVFDIDFGDGICGFGLLAHVEQTVTRTTFFDSAGQPVRGLLTGPIFVTFTNDDTDESLTLAIPGPTFYDAAGNPMRGTGPWATFTSDGRFVWAAGNIVFDEDGNASSISGTSISVCDLL